MYGRPMSWEPVLDGALAEEARAAARAIALDLDRIDPARRSPVDEALMWAYVAGAFGDELSASRFEDAITALHTHLEAPVSFLGLFGGLAGAACATLAATPAGLGDAVTPHVSRSSNRGPRTRAHATVRCWTSRSTR